MGEVGDDCLKCLDEGELGKGLDILLKSGFYNEKKKRRGKERKQRRRGAGRHTMGETPVECSVFHWLSLANKIAIWYLVLKQKRCVCYSLYIY
jgi:hypothetical protein